MAGRGCATRAGEMLVQCSWVDALPPGIFTQDRGRQDIWFLFRVGPFAIWGNEVLFNSIERHHHAY